ncbi:hypothetical protein [Nocardioides sp.]|uniref:hypothetical protein n=1 Tax=Nocardioides sp. TaxID=35761 RepID=UPI002BC552A3|nr:hypothetical protein [Nocardioides sp.]HXH77501.1 hypothetical protein [Nocardioides sp.]
MLRPLISAFVTAMLAGLLGLGLGVAAATSAHAMPRDAAVDLETDLTLLVPSCEDCVITLFSWDGLTPIYSSAPELVEDGSVTITLPTARTAGMSVQVDPTWADSKADTYIAWRYADAEIGDSVTLAQARTKSRASGCWAGTVNEAVTLKIKVRRVERNGRTVAMAWAPVTESFVRPMERVRSGVLVSGDVLACDLS